LSSGIQNIGKIPELNRRILITILLLAVYRIGVFVPTPGVDAQALSNFFTQARGTLLDFVVMFTGGALEQFSVFALGIMPYISASIIIQLLTVVLPHLERLSKEGESGRRQIVKYTRYGTMVLSAIQGLGISIGLESMRGPAGELVVPIPGWDFRIMTIITLTAGTAFIMWLGEQITERGIGNGISLIIFAGIVARLPQAIGNTFGLVKTGEMNLLLVLLLVLVMIAVIAFIIFVELGQRRIPIQYPKRMVGRKIYGGQSTHLPLKVNSAGVIPPIFASSLIIFPATAVNFIELPWLKDISNSLNPTGILYNVLYAGLIIFFTYFYTAVTFNPQKISEEIQKHGGFIPGIRPGRVTAEYLQYILTRLTLAGALFLGILAILPSIARGITGVSTLMLGGTGILIVVSVVLETVKSLEAQLVMRNYEGFL